MADAVVTPGLAAVTHAGVAAAGNRPRHSAIVRVTHWITALCFAALLVSGVEILISHPRFYWGETGNVRMTPLFTLPIPASRGSVPTGYGYVLKDQNSWSRSLHFQSAWLLVIAGLLYLIHGLRTRHFKDNLLSGISAASLRQAIAEHLRSKGRGASSPEAWSYNALQRLSYLGVIFLLFPLAIWTGLAMSPAFVSAFPITVTTFGGQQSARTIHFFLTVILVAFVLVHTAMVYRAGFTNRVRAMITGRAAASAGHKESA